MENQSSSQNNLEESSDQKRSNTLKSWKPAKQKKYSDQIKSHNYYNAVKYVPSYEKDPVDMFLLMSMEYSRMWRNELENTKKVIAKLQKSKVFMQRSYVVRGFLKRKKTTEPKKLYKMKKFENVGPKLKLIRCPLAPEDAALTSNKTRDKGTETTANVCCDEKCTIQYK